MRRPAAASALAFAALVVWGLLFQGSRGIFEPDEGFYSNVALHMAESGDWVVPHLNQGVFLDKPPLHYWSMAAGLALVGRNEWGVRLAHALWFAATAWLVGKIAALLLEPSRRWRATIAYALSLLPFVAANIATPDTPLAFWAVLATYGYLHSRAEPSAWRYLALCAVAIGCGMLTKGPAALMLAAPICLDRLWQVRSRRWTPDVVAALIAVGLGLSWYVAVARRIPGAAAYILDNEVTGRLVTSSYGRNSGLLGALIYLPVVLLGGLPWSVFWPSWLRSFRRLHAGWRDLGGSVWSEPGQRFLVLWLAVPAAVLLVAQSRLPLYALPLFAPLAILAGAKLPAAVSAPSTRAGAALVLWCLVLVGAKAVPAHLAWREDSRAMSAALAAFVPDRTTPVVMLETKRNGLALYGWQDLRAAAMWREVYPFFAPPPTLATVLQALGPRPIALVLSAPNLESAIGILRAARWTCESQVGPFSTAFLRCRPPES